jgi:hypothetical protein
MDWPRWAKWFYERRLPDEIGVGDTAKRLFSKMGGEQYQLLVRNIGMPCRCDKRQQEWNAKYSYEDSLSHSG